jgi:hypothetical protein
MNKLREALSTRNLNIPVDIKPQHIFYGMGKITMSENGELIMKACDSNGYLFTSSSNEEVYGNTHKDNMHVYD